MKKIIKKVEKTDVKHEEPVNKEQEVNQNKILRNLFIIVGVLAIAVAGYFIFSYASSNFTYNGVKYSIVHDEWVSLLYNTKIPVTYQGEKADYNFYLRNDPRNLAKEVDFNGSFYVRPLMITDITTELNCNGDGAIGLTNLMSLYKLIGTNVTRDVNATCDANASYVYLNFQISNETSIKETAPACYDIKVNNCDILKATERYMTESFTELQKYIIK